ncbi:MAG: ORF6N domain-containing protein [Candidatus Paceibacterota bacterium]|jgi:hypothetical protein
MKTESISIPSETIISKIFFIRGKKVMFDKDLAELYGVETRQLNQAVKRNKMRFPEDFMFKLNERETQIWQNQYSRSQIVILKQGENIKYSPLVFTEQGVAMLSSVLNSRQAIKMNIQIIRTFTKLREILSENKKLAEKLEMLELKYDKNISEIFKVIKYLVTEKEATKELESKKEPIGFRKN